MTKRRHVLKVFKLSYFLCTVRQSVFTSHTLPSEKNVSPFGNVVFPQFALNAFKRDSDHHIFCIWSKGNNFLLLYFFLLYFNFYKIILYQTSFLVIFLTIGFYR